jgi:hypothetical protein
MEAASALTMWKPAPVGAAVRLNPRTAALGRRQNNRRPETRRSYPPPGWPG